MRRQDVIKCIEDFIRKYWNDPEKVALPKDPDFIFKRIYNVKINTESLIEEKDSKWSFNGNAIITTTDERHTVEVDQSYNLTGRAIINPYPNDAPVYPDVEVVTELPEIDKLRIITLTLQTR